jgi:hypothetical protein
LELYKELSATRSSLKNTYEDVPGAESQAGRLVQMINDFVSEQDEKSLSGDDQANDSRKDIVGDFEIFFSEELDPTVPEPFYGILAIKFILLKQGTQNADLTKATKEAIRIFLTHGSVDYIISNLNDWSFQEWLFELNVSKKDDFNVWLANLLVEVSHEVQDKRYNRVASYLIDVLHLEAKHEDPSAPGAWPLWQTYASQETGTTANLTTFTTRWFELEDNGTQYNGSTISEIQFGTQSHTRHSGFSSSDSLYTTITVFLEDGSQFTRYRFMGNNEQEINQSRVSIRSGMESLAQIYEVTDGGHGFSSSGFRTSYSIGYWF